MRERAPYLRRSCSWFVCRFGSRFQTRARSSAPRGGYSSREGRIRALAADGMTKSFNEKVQRRAERDISSSRGKAAPANLASPSDPVDPQPWIATRPHHFHFPRQYRRNQHPLKSKFVNPDGLNFFYRT